MYGPGMYGPYIQHRYVPVLHGLPSPAFAPILADAPAPSGTGTILSVYPPTASGDYRALLTAASQGSAPLSAAA